MKLSEIETLSSNSSFSNSKLMVQSNSSIALQHYTHIISNEEKIKKEIEDMENKKNEEIKLNFQQTNSDNTVLIENGMNKEIYERLKNENINFIQTLLRLKQKMINEQNINKTPEKGDLDYNKYLNKSSTEHKTFIRNSNIKKYPTVIAPLNPILKKKENPIKIIALKKTFVKNDKKEKEKKNDNNNNPNKTNNNSKLNSINSNTKTIKNLPKKSNSLKNSINSMNENMFGINEQKNENSKKMLKQRTLSGVPNKKQIEKISKFIRINNKRNKTLRESQNKYISLSHNSTGLTNPICEIPSAVINLFDD